MTKRSNLKNKRSSDEGKDKQSYPPTDQPSNSRGRPVTKLIILGVLLFLGLWALITGESSQPGAGGSIHSEWTVRIVGLFLVIITPLLARKEIRRLRNKEKPHPK